MNRIDRMFLGPLLTSNKSPIAALRMSLRPHSTDYSARIATMTGHALQQEYTKLRTRISQLETLAKDQASTDGEKAACRENIKTVTQNLEMLKTKMGKNGPQYSAPHDNTYQDFNAEYSSDYTSYKSNNTSKKPKETHSKGLRAVKLIITLLLAREVLVLIRIIANAIIGNKPLLKDSFLQQIQPNMSEEEIEQLLKDPKYCKLSLFDLRDCRELPPSVIYLLAKREIQESPDVQSARLTLVQCIKLGRLSEQKFIQLFKEVENKNFELDIYHYPLLAKFAYDEKNTEAAAAIENHVGKGLSIRLGMQVLMRTRN